MWHYTQVMSLGIFCINSRNKKDLKGWVKISTLVNLGHSKVRTAVWYALMIFCFLVTLLSSSVQNLLPRNMNITFIHWIKEICRIWYREELVFHVKMEYICWYTFNTHIYIWNKSRRCGEFPGCLWLRLCTIIAEALSSIPGQGTKILQTMQCGQKYIYIIIKKNQYPTFFELYIIPVTALLSKDYFIYILE